ncbi:hypothetical protein HYALB_00002634 [Hymenoscyphus albidus]|uniref:Uncharacterized protein n=1 Tax=Hymenoscyphus albidus TaxID=595503 RepID=A0A9N9QA90_9HELO|nr:hypothetical protein HYALB_00002634 [Hymenoscyphus albidus]
MGVLANPSAALPDHYSLLQLCEELADDETENEEDKLESLLILDSCLRNHDRLSRENDDETAIKQMSRWKAKDSSSSQKEALTLIRQKAQLGLNSLNILITQLPSSPPKELPEPILLTLISYSSHSQYTSWTSPPTAEISTSLLAQYKHQTHTPAFQITYILQTILRPLFSASKPETLTSTGRKAITSSAPARETGTEELQKSRKPWKYDGVYAICVFRWVVENTPRETIPQTWHNFTPPLLTLLDDPSTPIRVQGAEILSLFLPNMSSTLLTHSGLGELFEDALMPTLLYLPNLTPVAESMQLLPSAYKALIVLCSTRFPQNSPVGSKVAADIVSLTSPKSGTDKDLQTTLKNERTKFLDRIMRRGIFTGYTHAMEHPPIVSILIYYHRLLAEKMGIESVKHLKDTLPLLATRLTSPFSTPSLLHTTLLTLQSTLLNTWPRLLTQKAYRLEVIKMLSLCWKNVSETMIAGEELGEGMVEVEQVLKEIKITGRIFMAAAKGARVDLSGEVGVLVESVPGMGEVFSLHG